jgi:hypothetical protein
MNTEYTMDDFEEVNGRQVMRKGTADQLDKMFANSDKIFTQDKKAMDDLKLSADGGESKGGGETSLSDGDNNF